MEGDPKHTPSWHSPRWHKRHPQVFDTNAPVKPVNSPVQPTRPSPTLWKELKKLAKMAAPYGLLLAALTMVQIGEFALAELLLIVCFVIFYMQVNSWEIAHGNTRQVLRWFAKTFGLIVVLFFAAVAYRIKGGRAWSNLIVPRKTTVSVPTYQQPKGPAIHVTGTAETPSMQMCQEVKGEEEQIKCLCPRPLEYTLKALPAPSDDNYSTEVDIKAKAGADPIYHLRIFARTQIHPGKIFETLPFGSGKAASGVGVLTYHPYSLVLQSSSPQREYRIELHSAEGLGIKCINQEN